jgi:hypothetical protein
MSLCDEIKAVKIYCLNINLFNDIFNIPKMTNEDKILALKYTNIIYKLIDEAINNFRFSKINNYLL